MDNGRLYDKVFVNIGYMFQSKSKEEHIIRVTNKI